MAKLDTKAQILKTGLLKEAASPRLVKLEENQVMQANGKYKIIPKFCGIVAKCGERQDNPYKKGGCLDNHSNGGLHCPRAGPQPSGPGANPGLALKGQGKGQQISLGSALGQPWPY